tara:strand:- start:2042 stop:3019 length:978 start_codon:yes stop_codon:yes gene_type:complete
MKLLIIGDPSGVMTLDAMERGINPEDITVWENTRKGLVCAKMNKVSVTDDLEKLDMRFDVIIGNPPYSIDGPGRGKADYGKFVLLGYDMLIPGGKLIMVHPPALRDPTHKLNSILMENQVEFISMHSPRDGMQTFSASTPYDWYSLIKTPVYKPTLVRFRDREDIVSVDFRNYPFIPNNIEVMDEFMNLPEDALRMNWKKGKAHRHISRTKNYDPLTPFDGAFQSIYKCGRDGIQLCYNTHREESAGVKKVVISDAGDLYPYYDDGTLGASDMTYWVEVSSEEEGTRVIEYLKSEKVKEFIMSCRVGATYRNSIAMMRFIPFPEL